MDWSAEHLHALGDGIAAQRDDLKKQLKDLEVRLKKSKAKFPDELRVPIELHIQSLDIQAKQTHALGYDLERWIDAL